MCSESLGPLQRHKAGLPAGTRVIELAGGGRCRFTPSKRRSNFSGGRVIRTSVWWVKGDRSISEVGAARYRAASRPAHWSRSLAAHGSNGTCLRSSIGPSAPARPGCFCPITCPLHHSFSGFHALLV